MAYVDLNTGGRVSKRMGQARCTIAVVVIGAVFGLSSCGAPRETSDTSAPATRTAPPGNLPKQIANMTGAELYAFANSLDSIMGDSTPRACAGTSACNNGTARTAAVIHTFKGQDSIGPTTVGDSGTLVMRMRNVRPGGGREAKYNLRPGQPFVYYVIAHAETDSTWRWTLHEVRLTGNTPRTQVDSGSWIQCQHPHPGQNVKPRFATCANAQDTTSTAGTGATLNLRSPSWMTCSSGCCTAGY